MTGPRSRWWGSLAGAGGVPGQTIPGCTHGKQKSAVQTLVLPSNICPTQSDLPAPLDTGHNDSGSRPLENMPKMSTEIVWKYQCQYQWLLHIELWFVNIYNHYFSIVSKIQLYAISIINSTEPSSPPIPRTANAEPKWDMFRTSGGCGGSSRNIYTNNVMAVCQYSSTFTLLLYISSIHLFQNPPACRLSITQSSCSFREKFFLCGLCWTLLL